MSKLTVYFARVGIIYLAIGGSLGAVMSLWPALRVQGLSAHAHINLLGFMAMTIYGVSYHVFPRFSGKSIISETMGWVQFWFVNIGLVGLVAGFFAEPYLDASVRAGLLSLSGGLEVAGIFLFAVNIWPCLKPLEITPCSGN